MSTLSSLGFFTEYGALLSAFMVFIFSLRPVMTDTRTVGGLLVYPKYVFSIIFVLSLGGGTLFMLMASPITIRVNHFLSMSPFLGALKIILFSCGFVWAGFRSKLVRRALERDGVSSFSYGFFVCIHLFSCLILLSVRNLFLLGLVCMLQSISWTFLQFKEVMSPKEKKEFLYLVLYEAISLLILLIGVSVVFSGVGSLGYESLGQSLKDGLIVPHAHHQWAIYGTFIVSFYFLMRLSIFPFEIWRSNYLPSAPRPMLATTTCQNFSLLFSLGFFLFTCFPSMMDKWQPFLFWMGVATLLWASFQILVCNALCSFVGSVITFSTGVALICFSLGNGEGLYAATFYFALFFIALTGFLFLIMNISVNDQNISHLSELKGLSHNFPMLSVILAVILLSFAAFPPFAGFWTSLYVLKTLIAKGWIYVTIVLLGMVIVSFQYFHVMRLFYISGSFVERRVTETWKNTWIFLLLFLILFPFLHGYIIQFIKKTTEIL